MDEDIKPLDVDGVGATVAGTAAWAVALVVLWLLRDSLVAAGNGWWIWVAFAGFVLGLLAIAYTVRRRAVYRKAREESPEIVSDRPSGGDEVES
ncbi:MAG: DUF2530 domain-containing protein [Candidatus Nanopelagicales bacterium]|nr:DUF2530 domain-containing protein [Candidatus Nanopelagicales bacterium]